MLQSFKAVAPIRPHPPHTQTRTWVLKLRQPLLQHEAQLAVQLTEVRLRQSLVKDLRVCCVVVRGWGVRDIHRRGGGQTNRQKEAQDAAV